MRFLTLSVILSSALALPTEGRDASTELLAPRAHRVVRHHHHARHHHQHGRHGGGSGKGDVQPVASPGPKPYCVDRTDINGKASDSGVWHNDWGWKCIDYER